MRRVLLRWYLWRFRRVGRRLFAVLGEGDAVRGQTLLLDTLIAMNGEGPVDEKGTR